MIFEEILIGKKEPRQQFEGGIFTYENSKLWWLVRDSVTNITAMLSFLNINLKMTTWQFSDR